MYRARSPEPEHRSPVRADWLAASELLPRGSARGGDAAESAPDAIDRRGVYPSSLLRQPQDVRVVAAARLWSQPQAGATAAAHDGAGVGGAQAQHEPPGAGAQDLPVPAARGADRPSRSGVVCRHYLHSSGPRVCVPHRRDGLVQPLRARLGGIGDHGGGVLRQCPAERPAPSWTPADLQHRPGPRSSPASA